MKPLLADNRLDLWPFCLANFFLNVNTERHWRRFILPEKRINNKRFKKEFHTPGRFSAMSLLIILLSVIFLQTKQMALPKHRTAYWYDCEPKDGLDVVSLRVIILKPAFFLLTLMSSLTALLSLYSFCSAKEKWI